MINQAKNTIVAAVQASPVYMDKALSVKKSCHLIAEAGQAGAKLVVFPEVFVPGYPDWIWVVPNGKAKLLNEVYVKLVENSLKILRSECLPLI